MVFFGIPLPAANNAIRMENLKIALQNDQIKLLSAATMMGRNPTNTPPITEVKLSQQEKIVNTPVNMRDYNTPITTPRAIITPSIVNNPRLVNLAELQAKIGSPKMGLKPIKVPGSPTKSEEEFQDTMTDAPLSAAAAPTPGSPSKSEAASLFSGTDATVGSESDIRIEKITNDLINKVKNPNYTIDDFRKDLKKLKDLNLKNTSNSKGVGFLYDKNKPIVENTGAFHGKVLNDANIGAFIKDTFDFIKTNPDEYRTRIRNLAGEGLIVGKQSLSSSRAPNFGNLWLNEKALKKNTLSIRRPYSNIYEVTAKSISNLLKKMIIDIANTLEFDIKDYENLEPEEKKIIERIINKQKDMKNYNIKTLIGDDINKARKRLEILFGQVNSGNNSSIIISEILDLLKLLYQNGALGHTKYNKLRESVRAHVE
jgi:hypothetical protein